MKEDSTDTSHLLLIDDPHPDAQEMLKRLREINEPILAYFERIDSIAKSFGGESSADLWALVNVAREHKKEAVEKRDRIKKRVNSPSEADTLKHHREAIKDWDVRINAFMRILGQRALRHTPEAASKKRLSKNHRHTQHKQWVIKEYADVTEEYPEDSASKNLLRVMDNYRSTFGAILRGQFRDQDDDFYEISESTIRLYSGDK